jgi:hypothetical protein
MPWHLETLEGLTPYRKLLLRSGVTVTVGRAEGVTQVFADDQSMSPVHLAIGLAGGRVRLQNLSQTGGTEVNGQPTETAALQDGDLIKAGQTIFVVRAPPPSPYPAQLRIGGWGFECVPQGWEFLEGLGFHFLDDLFRANITAVEEPLPMGQTLRSYTETQIELARGGVAGISLDRAAPLSIPGSGEAFELGIIIPTNNGMRVLQRQVYALASEIVGVFTATVSELKPHQNTLNAIINGLSYFQG